MDLTSEEVRAQKVASMPAPLGELHYSLHNSVAWLHLKWDDFRRLFGTDQATLDTLNAAAPAFTERLFRLMWEDVLLHVSRLTDPPTSAGWENLSLQRLPQEIPHPELRAQVQIAVDVAVQRAGFARHWRNRKLAHSELGATVAASVRPTLEGGSRKDVEGVLQAIRHAMNLVERHYQGGTVAYEHSIESLGGVDQLLRCLRRGIAS